MTVVATRTPDTPAATGTSASPAATGTPDPPAATGTSASPPAEVVADQAAEVVADLAAEAVPQAPAKVAVPAAADRVVTVLTAEVVETRGLLARIAVQLNPYDVRELNLCLETGTLRVVVEGAGFDAGRVAARLDKIIGVLDVTCT